MENGIPAEEETQLGFVFEHISVEQRMQVGLQAVLYEGTYGLVTNLARELGTSRKFVYGLAAEVRQAVVEALAPRAPGPQPVGQSLVLDRAQLDRAIVALGLIAHAPQRAICACLNVLYGVEPSLGYVNGVLEQASEMAVKLNDSLPLTIKQAQVAADELFAQEKPHLVTVEHASLLILGLQQAEHCDTAAWQKELTEIQGRGVELKRLASDGGKALAAAVGQLAGVEHHLDLWHALRQVGRAERALERAAYAAIAKEWELEKKAKALDPGKLMGGYVWQRYQVARQEADERIGRYDQLRVLGAWVAEALEAVDLDGRIRSPEQCLAELRAVIGLLRGLKVEVATKLASYLEDVGPRLLGYAERWLALLPGLVAELGADSEGVRLLCREWRLWKEVGKAPRPQKTERRLMAWRAHLLTLLHWRQQYRAARARVVGLLEGVMRGSSLAECVNSWLRPYANLMKGLGERFLPLFTLYRNSHIFERGKRAGHSPLELAGVKTPGGGWLEWLGLGKPTLPRRSVRSLPRTA